MAESSAMRLKVAGENPIEQLVIALGVAPVTLMDTHMAILRARAIMVGAKIGVFDAVALGPRDAAAIAAACGTNPPATEKLLGALAGSGYLAWKRGRFALTALSRKWLLSASAHSLRDKILFEFIEWDVISRTEDFVRTGRPLDLHTTHGLVGDAAWASYQRAMRALAGLGAPEVVRRVPVPAGATRMLDIGGSHGFYSASFCRKHPGLTSVVLDLPPAIAEAAPILAREGMGDRVTHRVGNALTDDLGEDAWDLVLTAQLLHHFDEPTNRALTGRIARALRPGGLFVILEMVRPPAPDRAGQLGCLLDLYFALTSQSGTWSPAEMAGWQRAAGLEPRKPIFLRTAPGAALVVATRR